MPDEQNPTGDAPVKRQNPVVLAKKTVARRRSRKPTVPKIEVKTVPAKPQRGWWSVSAAMLLALLAFSGLNLYIVVDQYGQLDGLRQSWNTLLHNYATSSRTVYVRLPAPPPEEKPVALYSVANGKLLQPLIESMVVEPLGDYYAAVGNPLLGIYIERKMPLSKLVRVHLFFRSGDDSEFLWPFTGKETDWWVPDCGQPDADTVAAKKIPCPTDFLLKYPSISRMIK